MQYDAELTTVGPDSRSCTKAEVRLRRPHPRHRLRARRVHGSARCPPPGELLCTVATVNDVHFGETECGMIEGSTSGRSFAAEPGEEPYPEVMNRAAVAEIAALDPDAVVVKGDLTCRRHPRSTSASSTCYGARSATGSHHVRGNHDAYHGAHVRRRPDAARSSCPGVTLAVLDTVRRRVASGRVTARAARLARRRSRAGADRPVLVFGHHHVWSPASRRATRRLLRHQPRRLRARWSTWSPPAVDRRLLRRPHPPQPRAPLRRHRRRAVGRGRLRQGLPGRLGRVPRLRGRHPAGPPPHLDARGAALDRAAGRCSAASTPTTPSARSPTAASRCHSDAEPCRSSRPGSSRSQVV